MDLVKNISYFCVFIVFIFEITAIFWNVKNGMPPFFMFDLVDRFSVKY